MGVTQFSGSMNKDDKIYVAGHRGMVGSAIWRALVAKGYTHLVGRTSKELDLKEQRSVRQFFEDERPSYVFLAAAKVGGIVANNTLRAEFIYENLMIQNNVIHQAYAYGVTKLLFLGSSCIYPKLAPQPLTEDQLLNGYLEPTNEPYAIAKIAGIKMCESYRAQYGCNFISAMPTNLYGPNDTYDLQNSHVLPALIRKFVEAAERNEPEVVIWGTGRPLREFLHVDDLAEACVFLMLHYNAPDFVNIGSEKEISIADLATLIKDITGFKGKLVFDTSKPDGTPRKLMDGTKMHKLGWSPKIPLEVGVRQTILDYPSRKHANL